MRRVRGLLQHYGAPAVDDSALNETDGNFGHEGGSMIFCRYKTVYAVRSLSKLSLAMLQQQGWKLLVVVSLPRERFQFVFERVPDALDT